MDIQLEKVDYVDKEILQNLLELYCYEWSQYDKLDVNQFGSYGYEVRDYWIEENHYPFFIKVNGKFAGFVLIDNHFDVRRDYDFAISEFFVMYKYRKAGVGRYVAKIIFDMFHGNWELKRHPKNIAGVYFWNKIIDEYTNGKFELIKSCQEVIYQDGTFADIFFFETI